MKKTPPIGVIGPIRTVGNCNIWFNDKIYKEPEKHSTPKMNNSTGKWNAFCEKSCAESKATKAANTCTNW